MPRQGSRVPRAFRTSTTSMLWNELIRVPGGVATTPRRAMNASWACPPLECWNDGRVPRVRNGVTERVPGDGQVAALPPRVAALGVTRRVRPRRRGRGSRRAARDERVGALRTDLHHGGRFTAQEAKSTGRDAARGVALDGRKGCGRGSAVASPVGSLLSSSSPPRKTHTPTSTAAARRSSITRPGLPQAAAPRTRRRVCKRLFRRGQGWFKQFRRRRLLAN